MEYNEKEIPTSNAQIPRKFQQTNPKIQILYLGFGSWILFGSWRLEVGRSVGKFSCNTIWYIIV